MKKVLWALAVIIYCASCQEDDFVIENEPAQPVIERSFYASKPDMEKGRREHVYINGKLISTQAYSENRPTWHTSFEYNSKGDLIREQIDNTYQHTIYDYEYNSSGQLTRRRSRTYTRREDADDILKEDSEILYEYEEDKLVKTTLSDGRYNIRQYVGDRCVKVVYYDEDGERVSITKAKYKHGLLVEQKRTSEFNGYTHTTRYLYDAQNRLKTTDINGLINAEYVYENNQLVRKNEWRSDTLFFKDTPPAFDRFTTYEY